MKLVKVKLKNFRGYKDEVEVEFGGVTTFVGKNDVGKSTVLEALDIFFNDGKGIVKIDKEDINVQSASEGDEEIIISACFEELPNEVVIDTTNRTSLAAEYLLNSLGQLEVIKKYPKATSSPKVFIKANHPTGDNVNGLLLKKNNDLKKIVKSNDIECENQSINSVMRTAIWHHFSEDLNLEEIEVDVSKEDGKAIWDKLKNIMPLYSLFQSDRKNTDSDSEVQEPLKEAVKQILKDEKIQEKLNEVAETVKSYLEDVSDRTVEKLREMDEGIASTLNPLIPEAASLKWADVFKNVSIYGDEGIPINKRGSGVKRLVLFNFFRAEAERRKQLESIPSIIYAVEEPETSQHAAYQALLVDALKDLALNGNSQVIMTTHSSYIVKKLEFEELRLIKSIEGEKSIENIIESELPYPSLNEVNYIAFNEITEEYHIDLYSYIMINDLLNDYKRGKPELDYLQLNNNGTTTPRTKILSEYIRHQIHHPENEHNERYTIEQLEESIDMMREFIRENRAMQSENTE